jgi:hypothetical protein
VRFRSARSPLEALVEAETLLRRLRGGVFQLRPHVIARCFYSLLVLGRPNMSSSTAQLAERSALIARILVTEEDLKAFQRHLEDGECVEPLLL